ncbi:ABC transporter substrate-binding protein [Caldanaerobacter sp.]|uniref:ABC transporter substrate-binding protein n=1 Tax=Caldanaerobacter sp. TaxID=2930036 RepID=UPI003C70995E
MKKALLWLLYFMIFLFLIYWPFHMNAYKKGELEEKEIEENFRGIITFWDFPHPSEEDLFGFKFIKKKIQAFQNKYPGVVIDFEPLSEEDGIERLKEAFSKGVLPDIFPVNLELVWLYKDFLQPITNFVSKGKNEYNEEALKALSLKEDIYGLPLGMYTNVIFIDREIFEDKEISLPEKGYWNYEEFLNSMIKVTKKSDKKPVFGLGLPLFNGTYSLWGFLMLDGGKAYDKGKYAFFGPQAISSLQKVLDMAGRYSVINPVSLEGDRKKLWDEFTLRKNTAALVEESFRIAELSNLFKKGKLFEFYVAFYPTGESGVPLTISPKVYGYGIKREEDPKKLEMEYKFIKFIVQDREEVLKLGYIPAQKEFKIEDEKMKKIEEAVKYTELPPIVKGWEKINNVIIEEVREGIREGKNAYDVITEIEKKVKE